MVICTSKTYITYKNLEVKDMFMNMATALADVYEAMSPDVGVRIEGCHSCMTSRGIKNVSSKTVTKNYLGAFKDDVSLQNLLGDRE